MTLGMAVCTFDSNPLISDSGSILRMSHNNVATLPLLVAVPSFVCSTSKLNCAGCGGKRGYHRSVLPLVLVALHVGPAWQPCFRFSSIPPPLFLLFTCPNCATIATMSAAEWPTRKKRIDTWLRNLPQPWAIVPWRAGLDTAKLTHHAVEEYPTACRPADYALFRADCRCYR